MNNKQIFRQIRADCFRFSRWNHLFSFLADFLGVVSPTLLSWLIGDMADYLLRLDTAAIGRQLPYFLLAMALAVVVAPLVDLGENLRLTRDGFAYDNFLMERMLRLPVSRLQTLEKGTAIERLTNDSPALMYNQLMLHTRPLVLLGYGGVIAYLFTQNQTHILYFLAVFGVSSLPVFRAVQIGKRRAAMKGQTAQYTEARRTLEQELLAAKELSWGFPFPQLLTGRIRNCHHRYMETTGKAQCRLNALEAMLDFLCNHGAQIVTALFGAVLVSRHMLTFGAMLGGLLMQPTLARCCKMIYRFIGEVHDEKQYLERMAFLYGETEDEGEAPQALPCGMCPTPTPDNPNRQLSGKICRCALVRRCSWPGQTAAGKAPYCPSWGDCIFRTAGRWWTNPAGRCPPGSFAGGWLSAGKAGEFSPVRWRKICFCPRTAFRQRRNSWGPWGLKNPCPMWLNRAGRISPTGSRKKSCWFGPCANRRIFWRWMSR